MLCDEPTVRTASGKLGWTGARLGGGCSWHTSPRGGAAGSAATAGRDHNLMTEQLQFARLAHSCQLCVVSPPTTRVCCGQWCRALCTEGGAGLERFCKVRGTSRENRTGSIRLGPAPLPWAAYPAIRGDYGGDEGAAHFRQQDGCSHCAHDGSIRAHWSWGSRSLHTFVNIIVITFKINRLHGLSVFSFPSSFRRLQERRLPPPAASIPHSRGFSHGARCALHQLQVGVVRHAGCFFTAPRAAGLRPHSSIL